MKNVAQEWRELGVQLVRSDQTNQLGIIAVDNPQDVVRRCQCVLEKWLKTSVDATWNQLIEALKKIQLDFYASELEKKLKSECKIIAMYLLQMSSCTGA